MLVSQHGNKLVIPGLKKQVPFAQRDDLALAAHYVNMTLPMCALTGAQKTDSQVRKDLLDMVDSETTPLQWQRMWSLEESWRTRAAAGSELFDFPAPPAQIDNCPNCKKDAYLHHTSRKFGLELGNMDSIRSMLEACYSYTKDPKECFRRTAGLLSKLSGGWDAYLRDMYSVVGRKRYAVEWSDIKENGSEDQKQEWKSRNKPQLVARVYLDGKEATDIRKTTDNDAKDEKETGQLFVLTTRLGLLKLGGDVDKAKADQLPVIRMLKGDTKKLGSLLDCTDSNSFCWRSNLDEVWTWSDVVVRDRFHVTLLGQSRWSHFIFQPNLFGVWEVVFKPTTMLIHKKAKRGPPSPSRQAVAAARQSNIVASQAKVARAVTRAAGSAASAVRSDTPPEEEEDKNSAVELTETPTGDGNLDAIRDVDDDPLPDEEKQRLLAARIISETEADVAQHVKLDDLDAISQADSDSSEYQQDGDGSDVESDGEISEVGSEAGSEDEDEDEDITAGYNELPSDEKIQEIEAQSDQKRAAFEQGEDVLEDLYVDSPPEHLENAKKFRQKFTDLVGLGASPQNAYNDIFEETKSKILEDPARADELNAIIGASNDGGDPIKFTTGSDVKKYKNAWNPLAKLELADDN